MKVDDPIHEVEADEADREHDAGVFVDVAGRDPVQLVDVFARVDEVLGGWSSSLFVSTAVDGVL